MLGNINGVWLMERVGFEVNHWQLTYQPTPGSSLRLVFG